MKSDAYARMSADSFLCVTLLQQHQSTSMSLASWLSWIVGGEVRVGFSPCELVMRCDKLITIELFLVTLGWVV